MPPSTLVETRLEPLTRFEEEGVVEAPQANDVAMASDPVGLSRTVVQTPVLTLGQPTTSPLFGLYLRRGYEEAALGYGDFLRGLEELKVPPLKDRRRHLKNKVFKVNITMLLSEFVLLFFV